MSPGAPAIDARPRFGPDDAVALEVTMPTVRPVAYVEIEDVVYCATWWTAAVLMPDVVCRHCTGAAAAAHVLRIVLAGTVTQGGCCTV